MKRQITVYSIDHLSHLSPGGPESGGKQGSIHITLQTIVDGMNRSFSLDWLGWWHDIPVNTVLYRETSARARRGL